MSFRIDKMTIDDKAAVVEMMRVFYNSEAVLSNGSEEIYSNDVDACAGENPYAEGFVFKNGDTYLGYAMLAKGYSTEFGKNCIWIEDIYIQEVYRGMGIGRKFFEMLFSTYNDVVYRLEVEEENENAVALYKKCGFEIIPYTEMIKKV